MNPWGIGKKKDIVLTVTEHTIQCPSLREYHHGPLWDDLLATSKVNIKAIWFADYANQGASGVLNEDKLGDDRDLLALFSKLLNTADDSLLANWFDHSRDLLSMVTHSQDQIQPPIAGRPFLPHAPPSLPHPHLSRAMIQIESPNKLGGRSPALWASTRPDLWPSRNPLWRRWDSRAVAKYIENGLRSVPTALYPLDPPSSNGKMSNPKVTPNSVTLTTTKAQEAWTYLRFNDRSSGSAERFLSLDLATSAKEGTNNHPSYVATCPWTSLAFEFLPYIRPSVLFVWGEKIHINTPGARRDDKLLRVGTGLGGSGHVRAGMVRDEVVKGASHTVPFEEVGETAGVVSDWLVEQGKRYMEEKKFWGKYDSQKSEREWMEYVKLPVDTKRERKGSRL
ncbi:hypothetical protein BO83DRAFT_396814 [Aspergillus eucalypticola CBS 122712]|uniref:Toxin biosynthesis protein n=1 Tax=Aspergillus eucalypticola (strain CBS 122712 / IBT 29274) TaxID=1448314 RepID=A0A317VWX7_ASPEC|nr:uncharacterized protein BO83DRAFT_396814 [Aspergillus eucalypticola CBS 122712]PWY78803.1 hypothetical protein BO83DRAFT_396814 [Aspergillus eucalypticola CBS 122712]